MKVLTAVLTICCVLVLAEPAYSQKSNYAILVRESPAGAGLITPGSGMHSFVANEIITLTTVAKSGYHFVYWLGDVSEPTKNRTTLSVDGPKIVIAVFERNSYETLAASAAASSGNNPVSLTPRYDRGVSSAFFSGGAQAQPGSSPTPTPYYPEPPIEPIPEPATIVMLAVGAYIKFRNAGDRKFRH